MSVHLLDFILYLKVYNKKLVVFFLLCIGLTSCESLQNSSISKILRVKQIPTTTVKQSLIRERFNKESIMSTINPTPYLSSVPSRPKNITSNANRKKMLNQLYHDRKNAKYNNDLIKLEEE